MKKYHSKVHHSTFTTNSHHPHNFQSVQSVPKSSPPQGLPPIPLLLRPETPSGFSRIYHFRNNIAHGKIDRSSANLVDAENLRRQAKEIVDELIKIAEEADYKIERGITYEIAIYGRNNNGPDFGFHPAKNIFPPYASS